MWSNKVLCTTTIKPDYASTLPCCLTFSSILDLPLQLITIASQYCTRLPHLPRDKRKTGKRTFNCAPSPTPPRPPLGATDTNRTAANQPKSGTPLMTPSGHNKPSARQPRGTPPETHPPGQAWPSTVYTLLALYTNLHLLNDRCSSGRLHRIFYGFRFRVCDIMVFRVSSS